MFTTHSPALMLTQRFTPKRSYAHIQTREKTELSIAQRLESQLTLLRLPPIHSADVIGADAQLTHMMAQAAFTNMVEKVTSQAILLVLPLDDLVSLLVVVVVCASSSLYSSMCVCVCVYF